MTGRMLGSTCVAAMLAVTVTAAQGSSQAPTQAPAQGNSQQRPVDRNDPGAARSQTDQQVTLVGCVARDGATDVILTGAMPAGASGNSAGTVTGSTSAGVTGTSGTAAGSATGTTGAATARYRLSGERDLDQYVGQRVEVVGRMDPDAKASAGRAPAGGAATPSPGAVAGTSGASAGSTTRGDSTAVPTASLPKITLTSVRAVDGNCL
jgi:hypothetical protein